MKNLFLLLLTVCSYCACLAQDGYEEPSPVSEAYHDSRYYKTVPPYGLQKVRQLIKDKIAHLEKEAQTEDAEGIDSLPEKYYQALSVREKFTYNMIYAESWDQGCGAVAPMVDEEKKIFGNLPDPFGAGTWSDRQRHFFQDNKDSVIALMTESIRRAKRVGLNYKHVILDINATSMIPLLIYTYNLEKKDHDLLTVLLLLMKNNNFAPFYASASYKKLYTGPHAYFEGSLTYNSANEALILQRVTDFYNGLSK
jgi:hypothetical protein